MRNYKKAIFMASALLCFNLSGYSQRITLNVRNVTVKQAMNKLTQASGYAFIFSSKDINPDHRVSVSATNTDLHAVIKQILQGQSRISYEIRGKNIILSKEVSGTIKPVSNTTVSGLQGYMGRQEGRTITGQVVDVNGTPVIGASIMIKGTKQGTITDFDGKFSLKADRGDVLAISYVGYDEQEVQVTDGQPLHVSLKEHSKSLDEVVVVGYGTQKKVSVTGSIAAVKGDEISEVPVSNITNALAGRLPGLVSFNRSGEPGYDDAGLLIRGASTTGDSSPLLVVDGVADRAGSLGRLDPNDIANITILKDASAAIYGSRAANGVILVTTKRGQSDKVTFNYTGNFGLSSPTILPEMCDSWQYAELINEITPGTYSTEQIEKFKNGSDPLNYPNIKPFEELLKPAFQTQHNVSASGGGRLVRFYASLGYKYQDNYYKNSASNYNQYNFRSNIDITPHKNVKIGVNVAFRQEDRNSPIYGSWDIWRFLIKYDPKVNIWYPGTHYGTISSASDSFSPAVALDNTMGYQKDKTSYLNADLTLHLDLPWIVKGLSVDGGLYIDRTDGFYKSFRKKYDLYEKEGDDYVPRTYGYNALDENMSQTLGITMNARINYKHTFKNDHNINVFVAYEQYTSRYDYLSGRRQDFVSNAIDELFAGDANSATNNGTASETARMNYFGRADYDYKGKYLFQFNWRYDGSENFPKGNRFGFFPGVSLGWRASEESFWKKHLSAIEYFKLRASWGQMGNDRVDAFQYMTAYTFRYPAVFGGELHSGLSLLRTANPSITWEVANTYNVGLDATFLKFFNLTVDFFKTKRNNILTTRNAAIPDYAGLTLPDENIGICSNIGTEITLGYTRQLNNDWSLSVSGNFSYNRSKINYIDEPAETLPWQRRTGLSIGTNESRNLMYDGIGIFRTKEELDAYPHLKETQVGDIKFRDVNGDNIIDGSDKIRPDKPSVPRIMYGLNVGVKYKSWSLGFLLQGAAQVWQYTFMEAGIIGNFTKDFYEHRWTTDNINAKYPRTYNRAETPTGAESYKNTFWLNNAAYLRLKSLELAYDLPKSWLRKFSISNIRLSLSGYNLLTFTGIHNIDPETLVGGQDFTAWNTPQAKVYNFGINITF